MQNFTNKNKAHVHLYASMSVVRRRQKPKTSRHSGETSKSNLSSRNGNY